MVKAKPFIVGVVCCLGVSLAVVACSPSLDSAGVAKKARRLMVECLESSDPAERDPSPAPATWSTATGRMPSRSARSGSG